VRNSSQWHLSEGVNVTALTERWPGFEVIEVWDPHELDDRSKLSSRLPKPNQAHTYTWRDAAAHRDATGQVLARHAIRTAGPLQVSHVADRFGTKIGIGGAGIDSHCFSLVHAGMMCLRVPGHDEPVQLGEERGAIHRGREGTSALTTDHTTRTNLWVEASQLESGLAGILDEIPKLSLDFLPALDWSRGGGQAVRLLLEYVSAEFARPDGIASNPLALAAFTDLFIHTTLRDLPHNHTERLERNHHGAIPRHLRRAEEYMRAHAAQPLGTGQIAIAAGCSPRALQIAFRRFRDTTPHSALTAIRLERVREALRVQDASIGSIARQWGFSNFGRFASLYRRRYGEMPRVIVNKRGGSD
jgi:AraC-like DNA-binding protein